MQKKHIVPAILLTAALVGGYLFFVYARKSAAAKQIVKQPTLGAGYPVIPAVTDWVSKYGKDEVMNFILDNDPDQSITRTGLDQMSNGNLNALYQKVYNGD